MNGLSQNPGYDSPEWRKLFANLLDDIEEQRCVLLLGPEIVRIGGRPLHQCLRNHLMEEFPNEIPYYYEREGFYLFRDKLAKEDVQRGVRRFFKGHSLENGPDETVFKQIAGLPLHHANCRCGNQNFPRPAIRDLLFGRQPGFLSAPLR